MSLSLTRKLSASEKMRIGSEDTNSVRRSFTKMVSDSTINFKKAMRSSSFLQLLRDQREQISSSSVDTFLEGGNTYDDFDVPVNRVPGVEDVHKKFFDKEGIDKTSDLIDIFFNMGGDGTSENYVSFKSWLGDIGVVDNNNVIATCISSKWSIMVNKNTTKTVKKDSISSVNSHLIPNVCGIITIGMCSCLMMF